MFALPEQSVVNLVVYNVLGQEVTVLADGLMPAGYHTIVWNALENHGAPPASGLYIYRLTVRSTESDKTFIESRKMLLTK